MIPHELRKKFTAALEGGTPLFPTVKELLHDSKDDALVLNATSLVLEYINSRSLLSAEEFNTAQAEAFPIPEYLLNKLSPSHKGDLSDLILDCFFRSARKYSAPGIKLSLAANASRILERQGQPLSPVEHDNILHSLWEKTKKWGAQDDQLLTAAIILRLLPIQRIDTEPKPEPFGLGDIPVLWAEQIHKQLLALHHTMECSHGAADLVNDGLPVLSTLASLYWVGQGHFASQSPQFDDAIQALAKSQVAALPHQSHSSGDLASNLAILIKYWTAKHEFVNNLLARWFQSIYPKDESRDPWPVEFPTAFQPPDAPTLNALLVGGPLSGKSSFVAACEKSAPAICALGDEQDFFKEADSSPDYESPNLQTPAHLRAQFDTNKPSLTNQQNIFLTVGLAEVGKIVILDIPGGLLRAPEGAEANFNAPWLQEQIGRRKPCGVIIIAVKQPNGTLSDLANLVPLALRLAAAVGPAVSKCPIYFLINKCDKLLPEPQHQDPAAKARLEDEAYKNPNAAPVCSTRWLPDTPDAPSLEDLVDRRNSYQEPGLVKLYLSTAMAAQPALEIFWDKGFRDFTLHHTCLLSDKSMSYTKAWRVVSELTEILNSRSNAQRQAGLERIQAELAEVGRDVETAEKSLDETFALVQSSIAAYDDLTKSVSKLAVNEDDLADWFLNVNPDTAKLKSYVKLETERDSTAKSFQSFSTAANKTLKDCFKLLGIRNDASSGIFEAGPLADFVLPDQKGLDAKSIERLRKWAGKPIDPAEWIPCVTFTAGCQSTGCDYRDFPWLPGALHLRHVKSTKIETWLGAVDNNAINDDLRGAALLHLRGTADRMLETIPAGSRNMEHVLAIKSSRPGLSLHYKTIARNVALPIANMIWLTNDARTKFESFELQKYWDCRLQEKLQVLHGLKEPVKALDKATEDYKNTLEAKIKDFNGEPLTNKNPFMQFKFTGTTFDRSTAVGFLNALGNASRKVDELQGKADSLWNRFLAFFTGLNKKALADYQQHLRKIEDDLKAIEMTLAAAIVPVLNVTAPLPRVWELKIDATTDIHGLKKCCEHFRRWELLESSLTPAAKSLALAPASLVPRFDKFCMAIDEVAKSFAKTAAVWLIRERWLDAHGPEKPQGQVAAHITELSVWCKSVQSNQLITVRNQQMDNPRGKLLVEEFCERIAPLLEALGGGE